MGTVGMSAMTERTSRAEYGALRWFWNLTGLGATTNRKSTVSMVCTCTVAVHDKGRRVVQNVGCPVHDREASRGF